MAKMELKDMTIDQLRTELTSTEASYYDMKFKNATSSLNNTSEIKTVRRDIARMKTRIREIELESSTEKRDKIQSRRRLAKNIKK